MRKIMLLGGSAQQVIAIQKAKELEYYTVLLDYLPDNPGKVYADKYYPVSTTDKDAVLSVAKSEGIDGIIAYATDPAAPTAAYVSEKLGLHGNPYKSVMTLCDKILFRKFLKENGFNTPESWGYGSIEEAFSDIKSGKLPLPLMVKPADSSGSRGVSLIKNTHKLYEKLYNALSFSKSGRIVLEEYKAAYGYQVAGDGLSIDGRLVFKCFGNDHFDIRSKNPFVPIAASFPSVLSEDIQIKISDEIQRLISLLGMGSTTYNFDIRLDNSHNVYLMEIAPRSGGNYIPDVIRYATGVDLTECALKVSMGENVILPSNIHSSGYWAYYAVHSLKDGVLKSVDIDKRVASKNIVERHMTRNPGDNIHAFTSANTALGVIIMRFESMDEMLSMLDNSERWIKVDVEDIKEKAPEPIGEL